MPDYRKLAIVAFELCNSKHELEGRKKIPLTEIAEELHVKKEDIQAAFNHLVEEGIIGDDGDYDHMNYNEDLEELISYLKNEYPLRTTQ